MPVHDPESLFQCDVPRKADGALKIVAAFGQGAVGCSAGPSKAPCPYRSPVDNRASCSCTIAYSKQLSKLHDCSMSCDSGEMEDDLDVD